MKKLFEEYSYSFFQKEEYKKVILSYDMEEIREKLSILKSIFPCISEETLFSFLVLDLACLKILKV